MIWRIGAGGDVIDRDDRLAPAVVRLKGDLPAVGRHSREAVRAGRKLQRLAVPAAVEQRQLLESRRRPAGEIDHRAVGGERELRRAAVDSDHPAHLLGHRHRSAGGLERGEIEGPREHGVPQCIHQVPGGNVTRVGPRLDDRLPAAGGERLDHDLRVVPTVGRCCRRQRPWSR